MKLCIRKLVHGGAGVGEMDGKIVFVQFAAPGDVLDVEIVNDHGNYAEARILKIVEAATCRVNPPCPVFGRCGGCQWQHISYEAQLEWKRLILAETLKRIGKVDVCHCEPEGRGNPMNPLGLLPPRPFDYAQGRQARGRNDVSIVLPTLPSPKQWNYRNRIQLHIDSRGRAGFYRSKSKEVVEFDKCLIADERINEQLNFMRDSLKVRTKGISLRLEEGPSFLQINTEQNEQLKGTLAEWVREVPHENVLELYAGGGNFTFALAEIAKKVTASDIDIKAIRYAKEKKEREGITNVDLFCEDAFRTAERFSGKCDLVLIDPPRKGCADSLETIVSLKPEGIIYISCDPATLARDVKKFIQKGYRLERSMPVDMFPQTYHIESVNLLII